MSQSLPAILIGNSFPFSLVRRDADIRMIDPSVLRALLARSPVVSFWGHENSRAAAEAFLGVGLKPSTPRPAVLLTPDNLPTLDGLVFRTCYVCSPEYVPGYRPAVGEETPSSAIRGWQTLRIDWR